MFSVKWWDERLYPNPESRDTIPHLVAHLDDRIGPSMEVLDIGAGAGERNSYALKGKCRRIVGVDLDGRVVGNPLLDEGVVADASSLPFDDASFDLAFCIYVLEHIEDPKRFAKEVARVLRPGGRFVALTPNLWHYTAVASSLTPTSFHEWYNRRRGRDEEDTFLTYYRLNTRGALRRHFLPEGFAVGAERLVEVRPNYLTFSVPSFLAGALYERVANSTDLLSRIRVNLLVDYVKVS